MQKLLDLKPPNLHGSRMNMTDRAVTAQTNISGREKEARKQPYTYLAVATLTRINDQLLYSTAHGPQKLEW